MKTITVKQPWASLICSGIKDIENRTWPTKFRGTVLIHASAKDAGKYIDITTQEQRNAVMGFGWSNGLDSPAFFYTPKSAIIGSVEIIDCIINHPSIWAEQTGLGEQLMNKCTWNWVLANPKLFALPTENVKGRLSFWNYELLNQIQ